MGRIPGFYWYAADGGFVNAPGTIETGMLSPDGDGQLWEQQTLGHFALVSYISDPLARFLDELRVELTPDSKPRAHVTILPPRPLHNELKDVVRQIAEKSRSARPFEVALGEIHVFEASHVIYLEIAHGADELRELYGLLNRGPLKYEENFPYQPHITIALNISPDEAPRLAAFAKERWAAYRGPRSFSVSSLTFVQHVAPLVWTDVAEVQIGMEVPVGG
jgi:2'-5' RNA ligase